MVKLLKKSQYGLRTVSEGKIYKKKNIRLNELTAALGGANGAEAARNQARQILAKNPQATNVVADAR